MLGFFKSYSSLWHFCFVTDFNFYALKRAIGVSCGFAGHRNILTPWCQIMVCWFVVCYVVFVVKGRMMSCWIQSNLTWFWYWFHRFLYKDIITCDKLWDSYGMGLWFIVPYHSWILHGRFCDTPEWFRRLKRFYLSSNVLYFCTLIILDSSLC